MCDSAECTPADDLHSDIEDRSQTPSNALSQDLMSGILKQVEFYLSDANLATDKKLAKQIRRGCDGFVPVKLFVNFRKVRSLTKDADVVGAALRPSTLLQLSDDGKQVRRATPLPEYDIDDIQQRTVLVENLPPLPTIESVTDMFSVYGKVNLVRICTRESKGKLPHWLTGVAQSLHMLQYALVEFCDVDSAVVAVAALHEDDDEGWGVGVKVRHLLVAPSDRDGNVPSQHMRSTRITRDDSSPPSRSMLGGAARQRATASCGGAIDRGLVDVRRSTVEVSSSTFVTQPYRPPGRRTQDQQAHAFASSSGGGHRASNQRQRFYSDGGAIPRAEEDCAISSSSSQHAALDSQPHCSNSDGAASVLPAGDQQAQSRASSRTTRPTTLDRCSDAWTSESGAMSGERGDCISTHGRQHATASQLSARTGPSAASGGSFSFLSSNPSAIAHASVEDSDTPTFAGRCLSPPPPLTLRDNDSWATTADEPLSPFSDAASSRSATPTHLQLGGVVLDADAGVAAAAAALAGLPGIIRRSTRLEDQQPGHAASGRGVGCCGKPPMVPTAMGPRRRTCHAGANAASPKEEPSAGPVGHLLATLPPAVTVASSGGSQLRPPRRFHSDGGGAAPQSDDGGGNAQDDDNEDFEEGQAAGGRLSRRPRRRRSHGGGAAKRDAAAVAAAAAIAAACALTSHMGRTPHARRCYASEGGAVPSTSEGVTGGPMSGTTTADGESARNGAAAGDWHPQIARGPDGGRGFMGRRFSTY